MSREHRRSSPRSRSRSPLRDKSRKSDKRRPERHNDEEVERKRDHERVQGKERHSHVEERRERHRTGDKHDNRDLHEQRKNKDFDQRRNRDHHEQRRNRDSPNEQSRHREDHPHRNSKPHERDNRTGWSDRGRGEHRRQETEPTRSRWADDDDDDAREDQQQRKRKGRRKRDDSPEENYKFGQSADNEGSNNDEDDKSQPNYELSGKLTEYTNTYKGVVIKYNEPPEARKPKTRWRLYPFKEDKQLEVMYVHRQSAYLIGRQRLIVDIPVDHPSCSKQHAVLQYRLGKNIRPDGTEGLKVKPYIIDLESQNGTYLNNQRVDPRRYYEVKEKDVLKFGFSTREYVVLTESSRKSESESEDEDQDQDQES